MADQSSSLRGLPPTIWVVLVVSLVGALAVNHHPFQDVRPQNQNAPAYRQTPANGQDVEARQWDDPLTAVAAARQAKETQATAAAVSDLAAHGLVRLQAKDKQLADPLVILGTMVSGAPYADDIETRRRTRYAVLAGLSSAGYVPDDDQHIGYVTLDTPQADAAAAHEIAAYEWFHFESPSDTASRPRVLVLWLDQNNFRGEPLHRFSEIVKVIAPVEKHSGAVSEVILGPADSDGLKEMSSELDPGCSFLAASRDISIYSPRATALNWWIVSDAVKKRYPDTQTEPHADHFNDRCEHVNLYRTVSNDYTVVKALYKELEYRGIQHISEIALITERDTLYARLISRYFNGCGGSDPADPANPADPADTQFTVRGEEDKSQPLCFTYLRGLDGLTPPAPDPTGSARSTASKTGTAAGSTGQAPVAPEAATGPSQLDYLRRMTMELASQRDDPRCRWISKELNLVDQSSVAFGCARRIKAIGIVGSDLYDKLMILQALRGAFPRYIFFTTDLDARLTDQQNLAWTQELVVGSSLGLSLRPELQGSIPPFRDSYQAATYYSTFYAVEQSFGKHNGAGASIDKWTRRPRVFEIGRTQAFDLTVDKDAGTLCETKIKCRSIAAPASPPLWSTGSAGSKLIVASLAMLVVAIIAGVAMGGAWVGQLLAPLYSRGSSAQDRRRLVTAAVSLIAIALVSIWAWATLVAAVTNHGQRVPPPIFSGASHWAASIVEALSILVVVTLVIRGQRKLGANATALLDKFGFPVSPEQMMDSYCAWLRLPATPRRRRLKERIWFPLRRLSGNTKDPLPSNEMSPLENLIAQYLYRGRWRARLMRVAFVTLVASFTLLVLEYILMLLEFNLGISFVRGFALVDTNYVERGIEDLISLLNLLAVQFLIFWVADAMLLTRSFVLALKEDRPRWPEAVIAPRLKDLGLAAEWTTLWLDLRLIAGRTSWIASLIWYPSLVIAAMAAAALTVEFGEFGFASNPIALVISAGFVVSAAIMLRRVAESWRSDVLLKLEDARLSSLDPSGERKAGAAQLDRLSERVTSLRDGAFAPYSQQPMVRAVLVPAVTYGATAGLQLLHMGN
ncbi:MAG TPA: hypothetical protein VNV61_16850 [Steroidobacteraceae bacterium]|nr:hypothetical protein [Steroidobacteraceae bacterium]